MKTATFILKLMRVIRDTYQHIKFELPFSVQGFSSFDIQFQWSEVSDLSAKLLPFKIFLILVFRSTALQRNVK
jgi:hypothetical protein